MAEPAARFQGKVALVTGGASGMGREASIRLAREGASVVVAGLPDDPRGPETVQLIADEGGQSIYVGADVSREDSCDAIAQAAVDQFGRLDLCLAAAGISHAGYVTGDEPRPARGQRRVLDKPVEYWEKVLAVNLTGAMLTNRAAIRRMIAAGNGGAIVNISSGAAKLPMPGRADYCVSKAGVWMLTKVLALETAPDGIRVNAIAPGVIDTPMTTALTSDEERIQRQIEAIPLRRVGEPADIAEASLFLLSDAASYITGQILHTDGGVFTG